MTRMLLSVRRTAWCFLCLLAGLSQAQELPIEYFTRSDETGTMKISPDGDFLALTTGQHGTEFLVFVNLADKKIAARIKAPANLAIFDFYWASNTRVVFMIGERQLGRVAPTPTGEIFAVDRDGNRQAMIYGYRAGQMSTGTHLRVRRASYATPEVVSLSPGEDRNIIISEMQWREVNDTFYYNPDAKPEITRLDIFTGKETRLGRAPLANATIIVDREDIPRFAVGMTDKRELAVAWRPKDGEKWQEFELPGFRDNTIVPIRFTADNAAVLFTGVREGATHDALFQFTLADHSVRELIAIEGTDVLDVVTDFEDREVIGVVGYAEKLVYRWLLPDHPAAKLHQALHRAFGDAEVRFINHSANGKRALVFVNSDTAPGEYLLFDTETKKADMIRASRSWVDLKKMRPREPIRLESRDGMTLHGYLTRPAGAGPHPLIVLPHGGPHGIRDTWTFDWEAQLFANRGYAVLQVNFRGSGGYGLDFAEAGYREWGGRMQDDITDATNWAIEQKITTADRICIYGASYGGYAALMGVVREPTLYRCAIGYAGVYDLQLMYETGDIAMSRRGVSYLNLVLGNDAEELSARSPANHAASIRTPVFLIHGKEDFRADYKQATRMKTALEKAGKPVEWLAIRGEGHGVYDDATRKEMYAAVLAFLDKHLKTTADAGAAGAR